MEKVTVSFRLDKRMLAEIDSKLAKHGYRSRAEFVLDAILSKLSALG